MRLEAVKRNTRLTRMMMRSFKYMVVAGVAWVWPFLVSRSLG